MYGKINILFERADDYSVLLKWKSQIGIFLYFIFLLDRNCLYYFV